MSPAAGNVELMQAALSYAARGWPVLPLHTPGADGTCSCPRDCTAPGKHPRIESGKDHVAGSTDAGQIRKWWRKWPGANVGIVTGARSGLVVVDCDPRNGGEDSLRAWQSEHGDLPQTPTTRTGGGGSHRFLKHPGVDVRVRSIGRGVDIKGDGGLIVAPPSLHASGLRYQWEALLGPDDVPVAEMPATLAAQLRPQARPDRSTPHPGPLNGSELPLRRYAEGAARKACAAVMDASEGNRNNALNKAAFNLGRFTGLGLLHRQSVEQSLLSAAETAQLSAAEAVVTIRSGLNAGEAEPHDITDLQAKVGRQSAGGHVGEIKDEAKVRPLTDTGNAERLVLHHGRDLRYCHPWKKWLVWDGRRWCPNTKGQVMRLSKDVVRRIYAEAGRVDDLEQRKAITEWAQRSERADRRRAMVELATSEDGIPILPDELDRDPWLLNLRNGTLDLRSGDLYPHRREDMITKVVPADYESSARCPQWHIFLERIIPDAEVRAFLRRAVGWTLTGDQSAQGLFFCYGLGANGKSTFLFVLLKLLGKDYAIQAAHDLLLSQRDRGHPTDRADLFGIRLAVCTEIGEGRAFDEVLVKQLTGGDRIRARRMREDAWEFDPTHHLWLAANHKPIVRGTDEAIWRRIMLVPFLVTIPPAERDPKLLSKLLTELSGILNWAFEGCLECQAIGLQPPDAVLMATQNYRGEMDTLGGFLEECCVISPHGRVGASDLFAAYAAWSQQGGERPATQKVFGGMLTERRFERTTLNGRKWYVGLALRAPDDRRFETESDDGDDSRPKSGIDGLRDPHEGGDGQNRSRSSPWSPDAAGLESAGAEEASEREAIQDEPEGTR